MIYAFVSRPALMEPWSVLKLEATTLDEARKEYKKLRAERPTHLSMMLAGGPSLEVIEKTYSEKWY